MPTSERATEEEGQRESSEFASESGKDEDTATKFLSLSHDLNSQLALTLGLLLCIQVVISFHYMFPRDSESAEYTGQLKN